MALLVRFDLSIARLVMVVLWFARGSGRSGD
jgi:hypothetical protein